MIWFPPVRFRDSRNGTTNGQSHMLTGVWLWRGYPELAALGAEEVVEFRKRWLWCALITAATVIPLFLLEPADPRAWLLGTLPGFLVTNRLPWFLERVEVDGRAAKIHVATTIYGRDLAIYEAEQARILASPTGSYVRKGLFQNKSQEDIMLRLQTRRSWAARWAGRRWNVRLIARLRDGS